MPITKQMFLDVINAEITRRKTSILASHRSEVNGFKSKLLNRAADQIVEASVSRFFSSHGELVIVDDYVNPLRLIIGFNQLLKEYQEWEIKRKQKGKKPKWQFFDMLFNQQILLVEEFVNYQSKNIALTELKHAKTQVEQLLNFMNIRHKDLKEHDTRFLSQIKKLHGYRANIIVLIDFREKESAVDKPPKSEEKHLEFFDAHTHAAQQVALHSKPQPPLSKKSKEKKSVPHKGILYFIDFDETSIAAHSSNTFEKIKMGLRDIFSTQQVSTIISTDESREETEAEKDIRLKELHELMENPAIKGIKLDEMKDDILKMELYKIKNFEKYFKKFIGGLSRINADWHHLIRPFVYALRHKGKLYADDTFYRYCFRLFKPIKLKTPGRENEIGMKAVIERVHGDDIIAIHSNHDFCDNHVMGKIIRDIFQLDADTTKKIHLNFYASKIFPKIKIDPDLNTVTYKNADQKASHPGAWKKTFQIQTKLIHLILEFLKIKIEKGYYPAEVVLVDDTADNVNLNYLTQNIMNQVVDHLFNPEQFVRHESQPGHITCYRELIQDYLAHSRDPLERRLADYFNEEEITEAAEAAVKALKLSRTQEREPINCPANGKRDQFDTLLEYQQKVQEERTGNISSQQQINQEQAPAPAYTHPSRK